MPVYGGVAASDPGHISGWITSPRYVNVESMRIRVHDKELPRAKGLSLNHVIKC